MYRIRWQRPSRPTREYHHSYPQWPGNLAVMPSTVWFRIGIPQRQCIKVDNSSDDPEALDLLSQRERVMPQIRVLRDDSPFNFSALNNRAVREAARSLFCHEQ